MCQEIYMLGTVWNLQNELSEGKIEAFGTHVGDFGPSEANLRFLKDVLYGLHVFAIQDLCSSLQETRQKTTFSHTSHNPAPRAQKGVPEPSKRDPKTLLWSLWKHPEQASKTWYPKKSLFALGTPRGICCLRALDPGNGTTFIYRYITRLCSRPLCAFMQAATNLHCVA